MTRFSISDLPERHRAKADAVAAKDPILEAAEVLLGVKKRSNPEEDLQRELIRTATEWPMQALLSDAWPSVVRKSTLIDWLYHIPNGGGRTAAEGGIFKAMGVKAGVWDLHLMITTSKHPGAYMELKAGKGQLTETQQVFRARALVMGYRLYEIRTGVQFRLAIEDYLTGSMPMEPQTGDRE